MVRKRDRNSSMVAAVFALVLVAQFLLRTGVGAPLTQVDFEDAPVVENIDGLPTDFAFLPPGQTDRILVTGYRGTVQLVVRGAVQGKLFLDDGVTQEELDSWTGYPRLWDRGLAPEYRSVAVDSDFQNHPYVYFSYVHYFERVPRTPPQGFVARYRVSNDLSEAIRSSKQVILGGYVNGNCTQVSTAEDNICITHGDHTMGGLISDPQGRVWISVGDSANADDSERPNAMRAQDVDSLYGKVLRVDRNGRGLQGNPFYDGSRDANRSKVMALGLRNPWNIHWDAELGTPWVSDVGEITLEEFNLVQPGANFGWPCMEAELDRFQFGIFDECTDLFNSIPPSSGASYVGTKVNPKLSYSHEEGTAITAALRVNVEGWPDAFNDAVYYCDYSANWIRYVKVDTVGNVVSAPLEFATGVPGPINLRPGSDGCLYYLALASSQIGRICYRENNSPPEVVGIVPPDGFMGAARSTLVEVAVSKKVTPESAQAAIVVVETVSGDLVAGHVEQDEVRNILTFVPNELLKEDAEYTVTVSGLIDWKNLSMIDELTSTFHTGRGFVKYVSDLALSVDPTPESVFRDTAIDGVTPILIRGRRFRKGLSFVPVVEVEVQVPADCTSIEGFYGMDDTARWILAGAIIFTIAVDGSIVYDSTVDGLGFPSRKIDPAIFFSLDVESGSTLTLGGDFGRRHELQEDNRGAWADVKFRCGNIDSRAPKVESFEPADGATTSIDPVIRITFDEVMNYNTVIQAVSIASMDGRSVPWLPVESAEPRLFALELEDLEFDTVYVITVSKTAVDVSGNPLEEDLQWSFATELPPASGEKIQLVEDLTPKRSRGGVSFNGFPRNLSPGVKIYKSGLGMQATATVSFDLGGLGCTRLRGLTGKDAAAGGDSGACRLQVFSGASEETSRVRLDRFPRAGQRSRGLSVDLGGDSYLEIKVSAGGDEGHAKDLCDIARARVVCEGVDTYLSKLTPLSERGIVEWNRSAVQLPLQLLRSSMTFETGIVIPAGAEVTYAIPGRCSTISFTVGAGNGADFGDTELVTSVDGETVCTDQKFFHRDGARILSCNVEGGEELKLEAIRGDTGGAIIIGEAELDCAVGTRKPVCELGSLPNSFRVGDTIEYAGQGYRFNGEELDESAISWDITLVHCEPECHDHPEARVEGRNSGSYEIPDHGDYFFIKIDCTVTDGGEVSKTSASVLPETALVTVESVPTGKVATVDGTNGETPLLNTVVVGSTFTVDVDPVAFGIWSHDNTLGPTFDYHLESNTPVVFTANYN
uniref:Glycosyl hydrolase family 98 putative carbohydrate-binding module domain-containing protein n=1 Tax=Rhodosorus marinus TaxID=101924 RepID=A0A7S3ECY6_9RHOD|mmetsp:Transcript_23860/g.93839  ORF Transcript_23860/g.93839 Transcript_23860/m.93839 type:complete len:1272 (+) Transcript_23860:291-4106(+)